MTRLHHQIRARAEAVRDVELFFLLDRSDFCDSLWKVHDPAGRIACRGHININDAKTAHVIIDILIGEYEYCHVPRTFKDSRGLDADPFKSSLVKHRDHQ